MNIDDISLTLDDGRVVKAALARAKGDNAPGLILIHEWWGLLDETRATAARLAALGFTTLAVDLFDGRSTHDEAVAAELMNGIDPARTAATLTAWNRWLRSQGAPKVGTLGFCFGGTWALSAALASPVDAVVAFYGWVVRPASELAALQGPVQAHFGSKDAFVPAGSAEMLAAALKEAGKPGETYTYLADHAFAREGGPNFEPGAAALAWQRTEAFLRKHLGVAAGAAAHTPPSRQASFSEIPVISLEGLGEGREGEAATVEAIRRASETVGFFYAKDHGVDPALVDRIFERTRQLFALPREVLEQYGITASKVFAGYLSVGQRGANKDRPRDLLEAYNICSESAPDDPYVARGVPLHGVNPWPREIAGFKEDVLAYYAAMDDLGARLLQAFALALGLPRDALDAQYRRPISQLRLLHYPRQDLAVDEMMGARAHRDVGMFTILLQDDVGGLEVSNASGEWIMAPPVEGTFVINLGEMMKLLTNDRFASALHRVVNRSGRQRFSVPYFFNPDYESTLATLPRFIDEAHPAQFEPIHVGRHMLRFYSNLWPGSAAAAAASEAA